MSNSVYAGVTPSRTSAPGASTWRLELGWICGYFAVLGLFYLFHAPFRSHVAVRSDWYARLSRFTQLWCMAVLLTLHRAPSDTTAGGGDGEEEEEDVGLVFFPVFLFMTLLFALLHKLKRRLHMGVTYGASFLSVILNSLVVAALCTVHYAYTQHLLERVMLSHLWRDCGSDPSMKSHIVCWLTAIVLPTSASRAPLRTTAQLVFIGAGVVYTDYRRKKWVGYDPHAGLLWSDVFEVTKRAACDGRCVGACDDSACTDFRFNEAKLVPRHQLLDTQGPADFRLPPAEQTALLEAKYPINRPAMVSWLTAFAVGAYIQAGLTRAISLVTSESRAAAVHDTPKVFTLHHSTSCGSRDDTEDAADKPAVWFDWVADVGDGFNSTYEVARLLAQPRLRFRSDEEAPHVVASGGEADFAKSPAEYTLPRGSFVVVGGDLAYPRPTEETYTTRLFEPYRDALPGNPQLRKLFHARQSELVRPDGRDADVAHIRVLDAETVAAMACGADALRASRGTAEEALHSVPMLFAIPGNHDWFDGLRIFRKYMLEKTWIGGWLMPQRSSFFVLRLPYNWFMLCCDTGNEQDIDVAQRNYFLDVIEKYMDAASCVILSCHEPGWIQDAWPSTTLPSQPQLARVAQMLGTRLRLRLAGDIHNYSRHVPSESSSENPTLVTSGGGGAFMHEATRGDVVAYGEAYTRACAFPPKTTLLSFLPRLWGFRVSNWKFDILIGVVGFLSITPVLLTPTLDVERLPVSSVVDLAHHSVRAAWELFVSSMAQCGVSLAVFIGFFGSFFASTATGTAPICGRVVYCVFWTLCVSGVSFGSLACLRSLFALMAQHRLIVSVDQEGGSVLEQCTLAAVRAALALAASWTSWCTPLTRLAGAATAQLNTPQVSATIAVALRCLDPFEMLAYTTNELRREVTSATTTTTGACHPAHAAVDFHARFIRLSFHTCYLLFYWMTAVPLISLTIGCFLLFTTKLFQSVGAYDAAYSSFQIEDYKSFVRFRIDPLTRALHGYTIGVRRVPKLWVRDERFVRHYAQPADVPTRPAHLQHTPSRWMPSFPEWSRKEGTRLGSGGEAVLPWDKKASVVDQFVCHPHSEGA